MFNIIPKSIPKKSKLQTILFYASIIVLVIIIFSYIIIGHFQNKALQTVQSLDAKLANIGTSEQKILEKDVLYYRDKIQSFAYLFDNHQHPLNFLKILEDIRQEDVIFTKFSMNVLEHNVVLNGQTNGFKVLGEQLNIFKQNKAIKNIELSQMSMSNLGIVNFVFDLEIEPDALK